MHLPSQYTYTDFVCVYQLDVTSCMSSDVLYLLTCLPTCVFRFSVCLLTFYIYQLGVSLHADAPGCDTAV